MKLTPGQEVWFLKEVGPIPAEVVRVGPVFLEIKLQNGDYVSGSPTQFEDVILPVEDGIVGMKLEPVNAT